MLTSGNTLHWTRSGQVPQQDDTAVRGRMPDALPEAFTTHPLPRVTARGRPGTLVQVIRTTWTGPRRSTW